MINNADQNKSTKQQGWKSLTIWIVVWIVICTAIGFAFGNWAFGAGIGVALA